MPIIVENVERLEGVQDILMEDFEFQINLQRSRSFTKTPGR